MSTIVNVVCPGCDGTGSDGDGDVCRECLGQRHIAVDKTPDGSVPDGFREWIIDYRRMG